MKELLVKTRDITIILSMIVFNRDLHQLQAYYFGYRPYTDGRFCDPPYKDWYDKDFEQGKVYMCCPSCKEKFKL